MSDSFFDPKLLHLARTKAGVTKSSFVDAGSMGGQLLPVEQVLRPQAQPLVLLDQLLLLVDLPLAAPLAAVEPILWPRP
jgi:hypothetical protein